MKFWNKISTVGVQIFCYESTEGPKFDLFYSSQLYFCVNIGCKIKPVGCLILWRKFAKMWFRCLRAARTRTHTAAFTVGKGFRQIDKNSSDGNDKKMFFCQDFGGINLMEFAKVAVGNKSSSG